MESETPGFLSGSFESPTPGSAYIQENDLPDDLFEQQPADLIKKMQLYGYTSQDLHGQQLVLVQAVDGEATLSCFSKNSDGIFEPIQTLSDIPAAVGYNGIGRKQYEGDGVTPIGIWNLGFAFGILENPGTDVEYKQITENSYWVDDPQSPDYNRWVDGWNPNSFNSAEHLIEYYSYNYAQVIEYNYVDTIHGLGSAIFLHCGSDSTRGCIAIPQEYMKLFLLWIQPGAQIFIAE